ncbi:sigma-54-dependent Fis family transcriptional regulator [Actinophytocola sp.]|uniref:sigma-54-dependent Fis family transcriptional regulator n=1 Tax=Actinophytocola sp. TaxID=1872138 RepID=UPI002ED53346
MDGTHQDAHVVELARERFLAAGAARTDVAVRKQILASWQRSQVAGIDADQFDIPYEPDLDFGGRLVTCAQPVLDRLQEQLSGLAVSVVLTDADSRLLDRRVGEPDLRHQLDDINFAPGFSYAEHHAGTNGVGTAAEGGGAVLVVGAEHFASRLRPFACAGAPIRDPITSRIQGVIDITCRQDEATGLMSVLALWAAHEIEQVLRQQAGAGARELLAEFRLRSARTVDAVMAVGPDFVIANRVAESRLTANDREQLRHRARDIAQHRSAPDVRLLLSGGEAMVRAFPVHTDSRPAGVVLEVTSLPPVTARPRIGPARSLPGLVGSSPSWSDYCQRLRRAAASGVPALVAGEAGVGKLASIRAAHAETRPQRPFVVVDAGEGTADALANGATVVLRHLDGGTIDELPPGHVGDGWLVATASSPTTSPLNGLLGAFRLSFTVPPLRHRPGDIELLIPELLRRLAPGRQVACSARATRVLLGCRWPGNVAELERTLRRALQRRPVGDIDVADLPADCLTSSSRRKLSRLEIAERDEIVSALLEADGNRVRAAAALGIGRATLYRRMSAFGIEYVGRQS